jgi:fructosamine-3-kinase
MWRDELAAALGDRLGAATPVTGGDINDAFRVELARGGALFVKTHAAPPAGLFAAEAAGLAWLGAAGALRVPRVVAVGAQFLALEWLEAGPRADDFDVQLGRGLAALHTAGAAAFGGAPSFLATLPQDNRAAEDWPAFWIERRLRPMARAAGLAIDAELDALRARPDRFGPPEPPARLHGDLWWGNVMAVGGAPVLVDPAASGGHREVDLAMLALFGGISRRFVAAYEARAPLAAGWRERVPLWQLYFVLAHAALFGGGYGAEARRLLALVS